MSEPYVGEIRMAAFNLVPVGWAACDGQLLSTADYVALFYILGTTYGGDGITTFALPDLRGRVPIHPSASHPLGQPGGEETHALTLAEVPSHNHTVLAASADGSQRSPVGNVPAVAAEESYAAPGALVPMDGAALAPAGQGGPHSNLQPSQSVMFLIALFGIYPSR